MNINWEALTWNFPVVAIGGVALAVYVAWWLIRQGNAPRAPTFECPTCGRRMGGILARDWRYCPWCGTPHRIPR